MSLATFVRDGIPLTELPVTAEELTSRYGGGKQAYSDEITSDFDLVPEAGKTLRVLWVAFVPNADNDTSNLVKVGFVGAVSNLYTGYALAHWEPFDAPAPDVPLRINLANKPARCRHRALHGIGTGTNAEAAANTGLQTELTTQYNPDNTRATGTITEAATNIFQTVATNNVDAAVAITEHMVASQAATGGGLCLDRSVFAAINLAIGDGLQSDYRLNFTSGG